MHTSIPLLKKRMATVLLIGLSLFLIFAGCAVVKTDYSSDVAKDATVYYYLPETVLNIKATAKVAVVYDKDSLLTNNSWVLQEGFQFTPEMIADTRELLSLNYKPNALMSDSIKYAVNAKGLLETVHVTTEDRTSSIVQQLSEAPVAIFSGMNGILPRQEGMDGGKANKGVVPAGGFVRIKDFTDSFSLKASDVHTKKNAVKWNLVLANEVRPHGIPKILNADFFVSSPNIPVPIARVYASGSRPNNVAYLLSQRQDRKLDVNGILTRPLVNISIVAQPASGQYAGPGRTVNVAIADPTKLIVVPVKRAPFVKQSNDIKIADGIVITNSVNKPSSVEGFVSIPINIAKAIVSIPAQLIQFRIDNTTKAASLEAAKLSYQQSLLQSQMYTVRKDLQMDSLQLELQKADLRNQQALEKLKAELQTTLAAAQIAQMQTLYQLDSLKRVINSLKTQQ